jgi:hypothetical protein
LISIQSHGRLQKNYSLFDAVLPTANDIASSRKTSWRYHGGHARSANSKSAVDEEATSLHHPDTLNSLERLPNEIIGRIVVELDQNDLLDLAVASKQLKSVAESHLYAHMAIDLRRLTKHAYTSVPSHYQYGTNDEDVDPGVIPCLVCGKRLRWFVLHEHEKECQEQVLLRDLAGQAHQAISHHKRSTLDKKLSCHITPGNKDDLASILDLVNGNLQDVCISTPAERSSLQEKDLEPILSSLENMPVLRHLRFHPWPDHLTWQDWLPRLLRSATRLQTLRMAFGDLWFHSPGDWATTYPGPPLNLTEVYLQGLPLHCLQTVANLLTSPPHLQVFSVSWRSSTPSTPPF